MLRDPYTSAMMPATATTTTTILQAENNNIVDGNLTTLVVSHATPIIHQPKGSDRWVVLYRVAHKKRAKLCNVVLLNNRIQTKGNNTFKEQS